MEPTTNLAYVVPADQPNSVHEIAQRLFSAYVFDGGCLHLAGCSMEDRPFLRLEFRLGDRMAEIYVDGEGCEADPEQVRALGMADTVPLETTRQLPDTEIARLVDCGRRLVAARFPAAGALELKSNTVVCCKYTRGKLRFTAGERSADLGFEGWARLLEPPPFVCPCTGEESFQIATTDDGRIVAADQIVACAETGRRVLPGDLLICSATGRRAVLELMSTCPVSQEPVLDREMVECATCGQRVSPTVIARGECPACRDPEPVDRTDPRLNRILVAFPALEGWSRWRISETAVVYVLTASKWLRRALLVVDKESLALKRLAMSNRFASTWQAVEAADEGELLFG